ncbi:MAG TPA: aldo/keto reductase [Trebonia sp.]|nr:aldo/keto reductase [Trebonia sp.]
MDARRPDGEPHGVRRDAPPADRAGPQGRRRPPQPRPGHHGATAAQVRLAWTLQRGPRVLVIPGTGDPAHLAANVAATALRFSADEMARLTSLRI